MAIWFTEKVYAALSLFDQCKSDPRPKHMQTLDKLDETIAILEKKLENLAGEIRVQEIIAFQNKQTNVRIAIAALRKKKILESSYEKNSNSLVNLNILHDQISNASFNVTIANALKEGANALKSANKNMTLEEIENMTLDIQDEIKNAGDVSSAMSTDFTNTVIDEDDLMNELNQIICKDEEEKIQEISNFPSIPSSPIPSSSSSISVIRPNRLVLEPL